MPLTQAPALNVPSPKHQILLEAAGSFSAILQRLLRLSGPSGKGKVWTLTFHVLDKLPTSGRALDDARYFIDARFIPGFTVRY